MAVYTMQMIEESVMTADDWNLRSAAALHAAGHAGVALMLGRTFTSVAIDAHTGVCPGWPPPGVLANAPVVNARTRRLAADYCLQLAGGRAAERVIGLSPQDADDSDEGVLRAWVLRSLARGDEVAQERQVASMHRKASAMMRWHVPAVRALAHLLTERQEVPYAEAFNVFRAADRSARPERRNYTRWPLAPAELHHQHKSGPLTE